MKILIAGDYCPINRVDTLFNSNNYETVLGNIANLLSRVDYSVVNFESCIVKEGGHPINKCGPNLRCSPNAVEALKFAGFDCVTLANNHFRDYGNEGCINTIAKLDIACIDHLGGGQNISEAQAVLYKEIDGKKVAFINFCEHEFSIATESSAGSAPLDCVMNYKQIADAKAKADAVIVIVHGGHEYYQLPSPRMQKHYRWFIEIGADVVINHHQHCYSGYEIFMGKPIFYGLGNFCFDGNRSGLESWYEGFMVELDFGPNGYCGFELHPYIQCKETPAVVTMKDEEKEDFLHKIQDLNAIITDDKVLEGEFDKYAERCANSKILSLSPLSSNRYLSSAFRHGFLPSFVAKKRLKSILSNVQCESHRDLLLSALNRNI